MMSGVDQIRDVIAFPKTQRGQDLLIDTPSPVTEQQLRELHIRVRASDQTERGVIAATDSQPRFHESPAMQLCPVMHAWLA